MTEHGVASTGVHDGPRQSTERAADHELALVRAFVELADGLVGDVDVQDLLHGLAEHCVGLVEATTCGILLADERGTLSLLAAYPESGSVLELFQVQEDQGPCVDCVRSGQPVRSADLAAEADRWPGWGPMALKEGVRSVYATPLRTEGTIIGTLNLFGEQAMRVAERDLLIVRALADVATITILQQRNSDRADILNRQLQTALESRIRIEQAKGILSHSLGVDVDTAFKILRHNSRTTNTKLSSLADFVIAGRITATDLLPLPRAAA